VQEKDFNKVGRNLEEEKICNEKKFPAVIFKENKFFDNFNTLEEAAAKISKVVFSDILEEFEKDDEYSNIEEYTEDIDIPYFYNEENIKESIIENFSNDEEFFDGTFHWKIVNE